jgi:hypothetical protein
VGDAKRRRDPAKEQVKCVRAECSRTSRTPKASNWGYVTGVFIALAQEPGEYCDGWWCPQCVKRLQRGMAAQGIEPTIERVQ